MKVNRAGLSEGQQPLLFRWEPFQYARADPDISKSWLGRHLFRATTLSNGRCNYWLAPRSDDAVGPGLLGRDAGEVAARDDKPITEVHATKAMVHITLSSDIYGFDAPTRWHSRLGYLSAANYARILNAASVVPLGKGVAYRSRVEDNMHDRFLYSFRVK